MKKLFAITLLCSLIGSLQADDRSDAKKLVDKAIEAHGGQEAFAATKNMIWDVDGELTMGDDTVIYQAHYTWSSPDKLHFTMKAKLMGSDFSLTVGFQGGKGWESAMGQTRAMEKTKAQAFAHNMWVMELARLSNIFAKDHTVTMVEPITRSGKKLLGVRVEKKGIEPATVYFDSKTHWVTLVTTKAMNEFTSELEDQEITFEDYALTGPAKTPEFKRMVIKMNNKPYILEKMKNIKYPKEVDSKIFEMPKK